MTKSISRNLIASTLLIFQSSAIYAITEEQVGTGMGLVIGLLIMAVFGGIVGWLASILVKGTGLGLFRDILLGIVGAMVGGWSFQMLGITLGNGIIGAIIPALAGAVLVLLVVKMIKKS